LDKDFEEFAVGRALKVARELTWDEPEDLPEGADSKAVEEWLAKHPRSFWGLRCLAVRLMIEEKWDRAREVLEQLKTLYSEYVGAENPYVLLASIYKRTGDTAAEHKVLDELVARDGDARTAYLRLMELDGAANNWQGVALNARRLLAVNPLIPAPHRQLAHATEQLGQRDEAIDAYRALALLDDTDPAEVHYRLAKLLHQAGQDDKARREVLRSLEEAPRFLDAHRLLLELVESDPNPNSSPPAAGSPSSKPSEEGAIK
jgi:tetratricopeptide (TPR) repeat protein